MTENRGKRSSVDMSPGTEGSSEYGNTRLAKSERTRRCWSSREEEILVQTLRELVVQGWKSDNGFRPGYLSKVEEAIRKEFPATDLRVNPNIVSKIATWKKNYYSLRDILQRSGIGFNLHGDYMVDCDAEQWEQIIKVDPNARTIRNKRWPYWESWQEIFGKDRANGSNAEDVMEAVNELCSNRHMLFNGPRSTVDVSVEEHVGNDVAADSQPLDGGEDSVCQETTNVETHRRKTKKRKDDDGVNRMCELLGRIHNENTAQLQSISERLGYEADVSRARKNVFEMLGKLQDVTLEDRFDICEILMNKTERLDLFMSLPDDARPAYVQHVLRSKHQKNQ